MNPELYEFMRDCTRFVFENGLRSWEVALMMPANNYDIRELADIRYAYIGSKRTKESRRTAIKNLILQRARLMAKFQRQYRTAIQIQGFIFEA